MEFRPVTSERLPDLKLFSERHGKFRWCSCMRWRLSSSEFKDSTKSERVDTLEDLVRSGTPVGVLGYLDGEPVAWCSVAPHRTYIAIERSRTIPRVDDTPVWSIACFFVDAKVRGRGIVHELVAAAVEYARLQGARSIPVAGWPELSIHGHVVNLSPGGLPRSRPSGSTKSKGHAVCLVTMVSGCRHQVSGIRFHTKSV